MIFCHGRWAGGKRPDAAVWGQCLGIRVQGRCQERREGGTDKAAHPRGARLTLGHGGCLMADRCWPVSTRVVILEIVTPHCAQHCNYLLRSKEKKKKNISFIIASNRHKQRREKKGPPLIKKPLINHHACTRDLVVVFSVGAAWWSSRLQRRRVFFAAVARCGCFAAANLPDDLQQTKYQRLRWSRFT